MNALLRELITLCALVGLATFLIIPIWLACSCVGLLVSPARREKFKTRWPVYLAFGVATLVILYTLDLFPPRHAIPYPYSLPSPLSTTEAIAQADAIVEGSFRPDGTVSSSRDVFTGPYYRRLKVDTFVVPFQVDQAVRGSATGTINVKIYFTFGANTPFYQGLPLKEKLLLLLKQDPQDKNLYTIVSQNNCWLVLAHPHAANSAPSDPTTFVLDDAKGFLTACLDHPGLSGAIAYMTQPTALGSAITLLGGGFSAISYPQTDPARLQALRIGKNLGEADPEFLAIARKYEGEYGEIGRIARSIRAGSGDYTDLAARLHDSNAHPATTPPAPGFHVIGAPSSSLPYEISDAIANSPHPDKMLPIVEEALASPDPKVRMTIIRALSQRQGKDNGDFHLGNQLGNSFYPLVVKALDDPDRQVQYAAMGCIFSMSGCVKQRVGQRDLHLWATKIVEQNPDLYVAQYKAWWEKNKDQLTGSP